MYIDTPIKKYLEDLGAKLPAPGGGSAAALLGALGTSLINMVCNFTVGKENYKLVEEEVITILENSMLLNQRFQELIDLDVEAFTSKDAQKSLEVPLEICRLSIKAAELLPALMKKGNVSLISDVACAAESLFSAFACGRINVEINLKNTKEEQVKTDIAKELILNETRLREIRDEVSQYASKTIRG